MRKFITGLLTVTVLAAAAYSGYCAWIAYGTPARPVATYDFAPECEKIPWKGITFKGTPHECQVRLDESERFRQNPGIVTRQGDTLTIFYRGKSVAQLVPSDPDGTVAACDTFHIHHLLTVYDPASPKLEKLPEVVCHGGEFETRFLAMPDGSRWQVHDAHASPDGHMLADGDNKWDAKDGHTRLILYDWPSRKVVARFRPSCRPLAWQDDTHLTVTCMLDTDPGRQHQMFDLALATMIMFDAKVWRDDNGIWQMQATRWLAGRIQYNDDGDMEFPPIFSLRPLPHYTATR